MKKKVGTTSGTLNKSNKHHDHDPYGAHGHHGSSTLNFLKLFDLYGRPISSTTGDGIRDTHQTICGGFLSLCVVTLFLVYFLQSMINNKMFYLKDTISTTSFRYGYDFPPSVASLSDEKKQNFRLRMYVNDGTFDNSNSRYGQFKMHMYTNMQSKDDIEISGAG